MLIYHNLTHNLWLLPQVLDEKVFSLTYITYS